MECTKAECLNEDAKNYKKKGHLPAGPPNSLLLKLWHGGIIPIYNIFLNDLSQLNTQQYLNLLMTTTALNLATRSSNF